MNNDYRGWFVYFNPTLPVSGQWRAVRHGVGMNNNSEAGVKRMIDVKVREARAVAGRRGFVMGRTVKLVGNSVRCYCN